ncbi:MAG: gliding motility-associated transporter ATP-binding subunit GldA [Bacteroidota bacterium]|jgi:ABC-2 type transport system ATP-binding protein
MSIRVANLSKFFGRQKAVNDISFSVDKGEILGFLGPNGAGKSTTMKMITGYLKPDAGSIEVCGIDAVLHSPDTKKKIGYLPESNPLYTDLYVREYLSFIAGVHQLQNAAVAVEHVIRQVGLSSEAAKKIGQLSKGYKQRVGLAAAIIHDPEVLILDEPTTGLDPNQIIEIREVIRQLGQRKAILFSSHILQEVQALCKRVVIINKGELVTDREVAHLLNEQKQREQVILEIKETVAADFFDLFGGSNPAGSCTWVFLTADPDNLKKQLLEYCLQNKLTILSIRSGGTQQLEEIFKNLTLPEQKN